MGHHRKFFRDDPERSLEIARLLAQRVRDMDLQFLETRKLVKRSGGLISEEESDLSDELKLVQRYLKAWQVSI